jgi:hypothetical protein
MICIPHAGSCFDWEAIEEDGLNAGASGLNDAMLGLNAGAFAESAMVYFFIYGVNKF